MRSDSAYFFLLISLLAALMMIDMNGPDIEAVDEVTVEVKAQILASVTMCGRITRDWHQNLNPKDWHHPAQKHRRARVMAPWSHI